MTIKYERCDVSASVDQQEITWSAGESRTMQRLMLGTTDIRPGKK